MINRYQTNPKRREYCLKKAEEIRKKYPYKRHFYALRRRCNFKSGRIYKSYGQKGIKCLITMEEVKTLWFRDKAYLLKIASIDRIDNDRSYSFENCRFIEHGLNSSMASQESKKRKVYQYDKKNHLIKIWSSVKEAVDVYGVSIHGALYKGRKTSKGFIWKKELDV